MSTVHLYDATVYERFVGQWGQDCIGRGAFVPLWAMSTTVQCDARNVSLMALGSTVRGVAARAVWTAVRHSTVPAQAVPQVVSPECTVTGWLPHHEPFCNTVGACLLAVPAMRMIQGPRGDLM